LSIYAARQEDGALTVMVINLSLEQKTKDFQISTPVELQAEAWLFDPDHKAENIGSVDLANGITLPAQSITLYIIR
jgi:hypothetical protein